MYCLDASASFIYSRRFEAKSLLTQREYIQEIVTRSCKYHLKYQIKQWSCSDVRYRDLVVENKSVTKAARRPRQLLLRRDGYQNAADSWLYNYARLRACNSTFEIDRVINPPQQDSHLCLCHQRKFYFLEMPHAVGSRGRFAIRSATSCLHSANEVTFALSFSCSFYFTALALSMQSRDPRTS